MRAASLRARGILVAAVWITIAIPQATAHATVGLIIQTASGPQDAGDQTSQAVSPQSIQQMEERGNFTDARQSAATYLAGHQNSAKVHELLAYALLRLNEPRLALPEFQRSAQLQQPSATLLVHVGQAYVLLGENAEADKWTLRAVQTDPSDADAWYGLGRIRYTEERFADARDCFERVLKLSPQAAKAEDNLGLSLEALNDSEAAEAAYRRAIELDEKTPGAQRSEQPYLNYGTLLLREGKSDEARVQIEKAAALAPGNPRVQEQAGQLALRTGRWSAAEQAFTRALAAEPDNAALHYLRGQALKHAGRNAEAAAEFARSAALRGAPGAGAPQ